MSIEASTPAEREAYAKAAPLPTGEEADTCPTCGGTGPDQFDAVGDYGGGPYEARCGDDWHDDK